MMSSILPSSARQTAAGTHSADIRDHHKSDELDFLSKHVTENVSANYNSLGLSTDEKHGEMYSNKPHIVSAADDVLKNKSNNDFQKHFGHSVQNNSSQFNQEFQSSKQSVRASDMHQNKIQNQVKQLLEMEEKERLLHKIKRYQPDAEETELRQMHISFLKKQAATYQSIRRSKFVVKLMKRLIVFICRTVEDMSKNIKRLKGRVHLDGWSRKVREELEAYEDLLHDIYDLYMQSWNTNPVITLVTALVSSACMYSMQRSLMNDPIVRIVTEAVAREQQTKADERFFGRSGGSVRTQRPQTNNPLANNVENKHNASTTASKFDGPLASITEETDVNIEKHNRPVDLRNRSVAIREALQTDAAKLRNEFAEDEDDVSELSLTTGTGEH